MDYCKICFKTISKSGINSFFTNRTVCQNCYNKFSVIFEEFKINSYSVLAIYSYDDMLKKLIFQFKGCFDIGLRSVFLERHLPELKIRYRNYIIVPVPSSKNSDDERGFNHVEEIFSFLKLPIFKCIKKKINFKQSDLSKKERINIKTKLDIVNGQILKNKSVLLVDDILSTGSSVKACLELIEDYSPSDIKVLLLCKNMSK